MHSKDFSTVTTITKRIALFMSNAMRSKTTSAPQRRLVLAALWLAILASGCAA